MKIIAVIAAAVAALALHAPAGADAGSVSLTLDPLSGLASSAGAPTPGTVGHWLGPATFIGGAATVHNELGWDESWGTANFDSSGLDPSTVGGPPFGHVGAETTHTTAGYPIYASATLDASTLRGAWSRPDTHQDYALGWVDVSRSFVLDPFASMTFSGLTTFDHPSSTQPTVSSGERAWDREVVEEAGTSLSAFELFNNRAGIGVKVLNYDPTGPGNVFLGRTSEDSHFSFAQDSFGVLSLTVHNDSPDALFGTVLFSVAAASSLVPEPAVWALLLSGLLFIARTPSTRRC